MQKAMMSLPWACALGMRESIRSCRPGHWPGPPVSPRPPQRPASHLRPPPAGPLPGCRLNHARKDEPSFFPGGPHISRRKPASAASSTSRQVTPRFRAAAGGPGGPPRSRSSGRLPRPGGCGDHRPGRLRKSLQVRGRIFQIVQADFGPQALAGGPLIPAPGPVDRGLHHRHADAERRFPVSGFGFRLLSMVDYEVAGQPRSLPEMSFMAGTEARPTGLFSKRFFGRSASS